MGGTTINSVIIVDTKLLQLDLQSCNNSHYTIFTYIKYYVVTRTLREG